MPGQSHSQCNRTRGSFLQTTIRYFILLLLVLLSACNSIDEQIINPDIEIGSDTAEPGVVKFVALGDTGHGNDAQFQVASAIKNKCAQAGCDFVLLLGDNIYPSGVNSVDDEQFQTKFELPYAEINLPFYPVLGNHDYGASGIGIDVTKSFYQIQYSQRSSKWVMPKHFYQFTKAGVTFFALDTNAQFFNVANEQVATVPQWINDSDTTWKIAYGHHTYMSNGPHGNAGSYDNIPSDIIANGEFIKEFADDIWCGKVDLYLAGHDHSRQWLNVDCQGTSLVVSGAGSSTTPLPGNNPVLFESNELGFFYVRIEGNTLTGEFVDANGNTNFTHVITK